MTANQLVKARKKLGLTQSGLAETLEMTRGMIAKYESGSNPVPRTVELAIKHLLSEKEA